MARPPHEKPSPPAPTWCLMDVQMPGTDGIEGVRLVIEARPEARVLMLTMFDLDEYVLAALRAGASGFLLKTTPPADLAAAIRASRDRRDALRAVRYPPPCRVLREPAIARGRRPRAACQLDSARTRSVSGYRARTVECGDRRVNCTWAKRPSRPTSPGSSRSSASATACRQSYLPTTADGCGVRSTDRARSARGSRYTPS